MRRADRLFDIIQSLRTAARPMTAAALADMLEVTPRTIYRDIAALQASRVPIEGAPGLGYVLRRGFDLPPLMFTADEADAIAIGVRLLRRLRDPKLLAAAESVLAKLAAVVPDPLQPLLVAARVFVSDGSAPLVSGVDLAELRGAIRETSQDCDRLCRRGRTSDAAHDMASGNGLLCRRDRRRGVVRIEKRHPSFPRRSHS